MTWQRVDLPLESTGHLPVALQDQHTEMVVAPLHEELNSGTLLSTGTAVDDTVLNLDNGHGANIDEIICVKETTHFYWGRILDFDGGPDVATMDTPLDHSFSDLSNVCIGDPNLNKAGSLAAPVIGVLGPNVGSQWDITRLHVNIYDDDSMDSSKFGGRAGLTNGVVLRMTDGTSKNIANVKSNGDLTLMSDAHIYDPKAPTNFHSFTSKHLFGGQGNVGVTIRLDGSTSDFLQVIIQDDLSSLLAFQVLAIGHVVMD